MYKYSVFSKTLQSKNWQGKHRDYLKFARICNNGMTYRTHTCGELRVAHIGESVTLCGWVNVIRLLGGLAFVDIRDHYGITQLLLPQRLIEKHHLGREFVIQVKGNVIERKSKNAQLPTGEIEIEVKKLVILNASKTPPFTIVDETDGGESLRMQYRYIDLRRNVLQKRLKMRARLMQRIRNYLIERQFNEIETPFLIKSTPEGARDFVIPSRMNPQQFYALPQSPQTFKQLCMVAGFDRYFQFVKCFRDEDLRSDRQPEFTQLDCEMSFVRQEDVLCMFEDLVIHLLKEEKGVELNQPIPRLTYTEAMHHYGSDKPDMRFEMLIQNLKTNHTSEVACIQKTDFHVFSKAESILGIVVRGGSTYTRKELDQLGEWVKRPQIGMERLAYLRRQDGTYKSSFDNFFSNEQLQEIGMYCNLEQGDILLLLCGQETRTRKAIGELRLHLASERNMINRETFALLWVTDFPLFEYDKEKERWLSCHHPFTSPQQQDIEKLQTFSDLKSVRAQAYDIVLNGAEIGGGSMRIHNRELQKNVFKALGLSEQETEDMFGFILNAFDYGTPPHGGIAFGFDRICALLAGTDSIRDVIAFPKNNAGQDVMLNSPSLLSQEQLDELHICLKSEKN